MAKPSKVCKDAYRQARRIDMPQQRAVVAFPTCKESNIKYVALGHVSVFKGPFKAVKQPFLNGFGGKLESGERHKEALLREFKEEVRIEGMDELPEPAYRGSVTICFYPKRKKVLVHVYEIPLPGKLPIHSISGEFDSFEWYERDQITCSKLHRYERDQVTCSKLHSSGAGILPSDRIWLPLFLFSTHPRVARLYIDEQFHPWKDKRQFVSH